jgi:hypothetical protein
MVVKAMRADLHGILCHQRQKHTFHRALVAMVVKAMRADLHGILTIRQNIILRRRVAMLSLSGHVLLATMMMITARVVTTMIATMAIARVVTTMMKVATAATGMMMIMTAPVGIGMMTATTVAIHPPVAR